MRQRVVIKAACSQASHLHEHPLVNLNQELLYRMFPCFGSQHRQRGLSIESPLRPDSHFSVLAIRVDLHGQLVDARDAGQTVRLIQVKRLLPLATVLQGSGGNDNFKQVLYGDAGIGRKLLQYGGEVRALLLANRTRRQATAQRELRQFGS